jgi:carbamoylphosphate synthase large subunit
MKILFSDKKDWKNNIETGFQTTRHTLSFGELSPENIMDCDLVVPLTISDLKYLNEVRHLVADNMIPIPGLDAILLCDDKYLFNQALIANGFGDYVPQMAGALSYPYILKRRTDEWGANSHIIFNVQEATAFSDALTDPDYFTQEFIFGLQEYATHILVKGREIATSLNIRYTFNTETPIKGKDSPVFTELCTCAYLDLFSSVLSSINFEGLCCINYKVYNGRPYIFEINPRFGGSLCPFFSRFIQHIN